MIDNSPSYARKAPQPLSFAVFDLSGHLSGPGGAAVLDFEVNGRSKAGEDRVRVQWGPGVEHISSGRVESSQGEHSFRFSLRHTATLQLMCSASPIVS